MTAFGESAYAAAARRRGQFRRNHYRNAKLKPREVIEISRRLRDVYRDGAAVAALAEEFDVSVRTIHYIRSRERTKVTGKAVWSWLKLEPGRVQRKRRHS